MYFGNTGMHRSRGRYSCQRVGDQGRKHHDRTSAGRLAVSTSAKFCGEQGGPCGRPRRHFLYRTDTTSPFATRHAQGDQARAPACVVVEVAVCTKCHNHVSVGEGQACPLVLEGRHERHGLTVEC